MEHSQARKRLLGAVRRATETYQMIDPGDRIAVGVSGGKDSVALLSALAEFRTFYPVPFSVVAVMVEPGALPGAPAPDPAPIRALCDRLGVEFHPVQTEIFRVVFSERREENPCSLCARMRRGALVGAAEELGCNKLALGHHLDDATDTLMMNLFFEGRFGCFSPVTRYEGRVTVIRPLILARESAIRSFVAAEALPVLPSHCPENGETERAEIHRLLSELERKHKGLRHRLLVAMQKGHLDGF